MSGHGSTLNVEKLKTVEVVKEHFAVCAHTVITRTHSAEDLALGTPPLPFKI